MLQPFSQCTTTYCYQVVYLSSWKLLNGVGGDVDTSTHDSPSLCQPSTCQTLGVAHGRWGVQTNGTLGQQPFTGSKYCATVGATASTVCNNGYELDGDASVQVCAPDGTWTPATAGHCQRVPVAASCDTPDVAHATVSRVSDSLATIRCFSGWHFDDYGDEIGDPHLQTCQLPQCLYLRCDDGHWRPSASTCVELGR